MNFIVIKEVAEAILQSFRTVFGLLCVPVYNLIEIFYELFSYIARAEILNDGFVNDVYRKVGLILGLFMTFKLTFSLIQSLVDPNKLNDKKNGYGSIITRCIVSIVLLGTVPGIFREAFNIQNLIIGNADDKTNIIYRLIINDNSTIKSENFGRKLATELYFSFYQKNDKSNWENSAVEDGNEVVKNDYETIKKQTESGVLGYNDLVNKLYEMDTANEYYIDFDGVLCFVVGLFTAYLLLLFCIQTSIRVFQLAYLQLIAPIPIISYIGNPDGAFKKWVKQCTTTYMDLFIRLAIIYFVVYLSNFIISNKDNIFATIDNNNSLLGIAIEVFLLLGLFLFAKKVPDLIKDIFPMSKNAASFDFGFKNGNKLLSSGTSFVAGGIAGGLAGAATGIKYGKGTAFGRIGGAATGLLRGTVGGAKTKGGISKNVQKAMGNQRSVMMKAYERNNDGSTWGGRTFGAYEAQREVEAYDKEIQSYNDYSSVYSAIDKELESDSSVKLAMEKRKAVLEQLSKSEYVRTSEDVVTLADGSTRDMTDEEIYKRYSDRVKAAKQEAFHTKLTFEDPSNPQLRNRVQQLMDNAENMRVKGLRNGYSGFDQTELSYSHGISKDDADTLYANLAKNKKMGTEEIHNIQDSSGTRNAEYKRAKANAKYNKK